MGHIAILGTGLIGTSLGIALRSNGREVRGWDPDRETAERSARREALDRVCRSYDQAAGEAETVVLAGPLRATVEILGELRTGGMVTDVAGVKTPVVRARPPGMRLVAGHPMAGRERSGPEAATPALFRGSAWILCTDGAEPEDLEKAAGMAESVGAVPTKMTAAEHDRVVAGISHLPQMLAAALVNWAARDAGAMRLASGSFRDLTRVADSESDWWPEVLAANAAYLEEAIDGLTAALRTMREEASADPSALAARLETARERRRGMAPPGARVGVVLADQPGEVARVGRALERSRADVRDLQLRHALHGGGGVLAISVRDGEAEDLRDALADEGFTLE